jgi:hypothetical protein
MKIFATSIIAAACMSISSQASATVITGTDLTATFGPYNYRSIAVDPVTGKAYMTKGYDHQGVTAFASTSALESNTASSDLAINHYGTYLAAYNGSLYMHTGSPSSLQVSKLSATTGAVEVSKTVTGGMGSFNSAGAYPGADSFNWGGYSVLNPMSDGSKLYIVGGMAGTNKWGIATFDYQLNQEKLVSFDLRDNTAGFAFAVNGFVFFGDWYNDYHISRRVEAATGIIENVDITLAGMGPKPGYPVYMTGITYDSLHDTLYSNYYFQGNVGKATHVASQLGVSSNNVPEPSSIGLLGLGLLALAGITRRRQTRG